jgi:hypothetical protein
MKKKQRKTKGRLISVEYINDPEAAQKWMDVCIRMAKEAVLKGTKPE